MTEEPEPLSIEDVAALPRPGMSFPTGLAFSPDDRLLTYLYAGAASLRQELRALDIAHGTVTTLFAPADADADELSAEEKLRRERLRVRAVGVTEYAWALRVDRLLVPFAGKLYLVDAAAHSSRELAIEGAIGDARLDPSGQRIAFVQAGEIHVLELDRDDATPCRLTSGADPARGITNGLAEFVAQEEMDRHDGYWWSPDGSMLAFVAVDASAIPLYRIPHAGAAEPTDEIHRYPFAGKENARVELGVVAVGGGDVTWMDLGTERDIYLARVDWFPDGRLAVQVQNRRQTRVDLILFDVASGSGRIALSETNDVWVNLHQLLRPLRSPGFAGGFRWASEQSGYRHLYLHDAVGNRVRAVTAGEWAVDDIAAIDEPAGIVYFTATLDSPLERHLYAVSLFGGTEPRRLTAEPGMHGIVVDHASRRFADTTSSAGAAPTVTLRRLSDGTAIAGLEPATDPRVEALTLTPPRLVSLESRDGVTLHGAVYEPPARFGPGPHRTMVAVYGGPHAQTVTNSWDLTVDMRAQYLRERGVLVFKLDNRGSARRGLAFEGAIRHDLGNIEVQDQADGIRWLVRSGLADPARVGIYGWSYGGYVSLMALARAPETFKLAVAGAPVTDQAKYDTHYTERYMGLPRENPHGYENSSVMTHVANLRGELLLIHGMLDENVHFRHTARLINALIEARKPFELLPFPDERHMVRGLGGRIYQEERVWRFIDQKL